MGLFVKYNLFDLFNDCSKNEVLEAINSLNTYEQAILRKRFGINYDGNKAELFLSVDHINLIYSEIIPKIKYKILKNREKKIFKCDKLIPCINNGMSNEDMCKKYNLTRQELYEELSKLRSKGHIIKSKYYSDGSIYFKSNTCYEKHYPRETILTGPPENYMKVLAISDLHIGSTKERLDLINKAFEYCTKKGINIIICCGDFVDGAFGRIQQKVKNPYDQVEYFLKNYPHDNNILTFGVGGDHDLSLLKDAGIGFKEACENSRSDIIIPGYTSVDINIKNDNIRLYHQTPTGRIIMPSYPTFICLNGHTHRFKYYIRDNKVFVNVPSLSNVMKYNPGVVEISFAFNKGYVNDLLIKHISIEDEKVIDRIYPDMKSRSIEYKPTLNLDPQYRKRG